MKRYLNDHDWPMKVLAVVFVVIIVAALIALSVVIRDHVPCSFFPAKDAPTRCFQEGVR